MDFFAAFESNLKKYECELQLFKKNTISTHFYIKQTRMTHYAQQEFRLSHNQSVLHGLHVIRFPFMAMNAERQLKHKRHVLSQRVVAGTMTINPLYDPNQPISGNVSADQPNNKISGDF
jgi:hypothetical protein